MKKRNFVNNILAFLLIFLNVFAVNAVNAADENYSCIEDDYQYKECKFDMPKLTHGESKLISTTSGIFDGKLLVLCNNGKRTIINESCNYVQGADDACKGIPQNTWTGMNDSMCNHKEVAVAVNNGEEYKVGSSNGNGFINYTCNDTELKVKSSHCERPLSKQLMQTKSVGIQCLSLDFSSPADYDYLAKNWLGVSPTDNFCINQGYDYLDSFALLSDQLELNTTNIGRYDAVCCQNDTLSSPSVEMTVTTINSDSATVTGISQGSYNDITGLYDNKPSFEQILNNFCKPNGYNQLTTFDTSNITVGSYTYTDEFNVSAICSGNNAIADNNTECKGAFLSSGSNAETEARALGVPYMCDSSGGSMECYQNTCTPFVKDAELCAECDLGSFDFTANNNTCTTDFPIILTGHDDTEKFYNATHSGYADVSCNNGQENVEDARCFRNCLNKRVSWENDKETAVCYFDLSGSKYRHYLEPSDNDRTNPNMELGDKTDRIITVQNTGVADFHCEDGDWVENQEDLTKQLCFSDCSSTTVSWGTGYSKDGRDKTNACKAAVGNKRHYLQPDYTSPYGVDPMQNASIDANTNLKTGTSLGLHVGASAFRCNDGSWELGGASECNLDCNAQKVSWTVGGYTCSNNVGAVKHGISRNNVKASGANTGQGTFNRTTSSVADFVCNDGKYVLQNNATCWGDTKPSSVTVDSPNQNNVCTFSWGVENHYDSGSLSATGGTGSANYSVVNGEMKLTDVVCNAKCSTETVKWARSSGASAGCPSGFTNNSGTCEKTNIVNPTCPSGYTFNPADDSEQCEKSVGVTDTYAATASCDGDYSDYTENGFSCEKSYSTGVTCPNGYLFNGTECVQDLVGGASTSNSWVCPDNTYTFHSTYTETETVGTNCTSTTKVGTVNLSCAGYDETLINSAECKINGINSDVCCVYKETIDLWCKYGSECRNLFIEYGYQRKSCSTGTVSGNDCVVESIVACPTNDTNYTNVCVKDEKVAPTCSSGYSFNTSSGVCESTSLQDANLSCPRGGQLTSCGTIKAMTKGNWYMHDCAEFGINGQACLSSEYNCSGTWDERRICDWFVDPPEADCPSGSSLNRTTGQCTITNKKAATCASGQTLIGNDCVAYIIEDAEEEVLVAGASAGQCGSVTLDTGGTASTTLNGSLCTYFHSVAKTATETCPAGGTSTGEICYDSGTSLESEAPDCSNGGTINSATNKCVALQTIPAESSDPVFCKATASARNHTGTRSLTDNVTDLATGSAPVSCVDGNWVVATNASCYKDCNPTISSTTNSNGTMIWLTGDTLASDHIAYNDKCSTSNIAMTNYGHGASTTKNTLNTGIKLNGKISYTCNDGYWDSSGETCSRVLCASSPETFTAASSCDITTTQLSYGDKENHDQPAGKSGTTDAIYTCGTSGSIGLSNTPDCYADCSLNNASITWNNQVNGCSTSVTSYISHGATKDVSDSGGTSRGDVTLTCTNGSISNSGELCIAYTAKSTSVTWGSCSGTTAGNISNDGDAGGTDCTTASNSKSGYTGSTKVCATTTGTTLSSSVCNANCASGATVTWGSCSGSTSGTTHNGTSSVSHSGSSAWSGTATASCNNGTWSASGSCTSTCSSTPFTPTCSTGYTYNSTSKKCEKGGADSWSNVPNDRGGVCNVPSNTSGSGSVKSGSCTTGATNFVSVCNTQCEPTFCSWQDRKIGTCPTKYCSSTTQTCSSTLSQQTPTCPSGSELVSGMCVESCSITPPVVVVPTTDCPQTSLNADRILTDVVENAYYLPDGDIWVNSVTNCVGETAPTGSSGDNHSVTCDVYSTEQQCEYGNNCREFTGISRETAVLTCQATIWTY
jgi:hypothetical protein